MDEQREALEEAAACLRRQLARVAEDSIAGRRLFRCISQVGLGFAQLEEAEEERAAADRAVT